LPHHPASTSLRGEPTANNFLYAPTKLQRALTGDIRIDHNFSAGDRIYGRFSYNPVQSPPR
jgi:hypothetical protein